MKSCLTSARLVTTICHNPYGRWSPEPVEPSLKRGRVLWASPEPPFLGSPSEDTALGLPKVRLGSSLPASTSPLIAQAPLSLKMRRLRGHTNTVAACPVAPSKKPISKRPCKPLHLCGGFVYDGGIKKTLVLLIPDSMESRAP
jgi:hypothetical protein